MIEILKNWNLIVPISVNEADREIIWDGYIEIKKGDPSYEEYLKKYQHDKMIKDNIDNLLDNGK